MHFWAVSESGSTLFAPLREAFEALPAATQSRWKRLSFISDHGVAHPLVCRHPTRGDATLEFHCAAPFVRTFATDLDRSTGRAASFTDASATEATLREIADALAAQAFELHWETGDFALLDNRALGHFASPGTQRAAEDDGLRILHRTTVKGRERPRPLFDGGGGDGGGGGVS